MLDEIFKDKRIKELLPFMAVAVALILIAGAWFVGYRTADGAPDVIDLTNAQTNSIIKEQSRECDKIVRAETRVLEDIVDEKDELIDKLYNYRNVLSSFITINNNKITELKDVIIDLNTSVNDMNFDCNC